MTKSEVAVGGQMVVHCADAAPRQAPPPPASAGGVAGGGREPEGIPCPRCDSVNTKFCYYNNYNLSQPRHFCRACRRYWTRGGALRNVPVGGGMRKATPAGRRKRSAAAASAPAPASPSCYTTPPPAAPFMMRPPYGLGVGLGLPFSASPLAAVDPDRLLLDLGGSFTSLIAPDLVGGGGHLSAAAAFLLGGYAPAVGSAAAALPPPPPPQTPQLLPQASQQQQQQPQPVSQALPAEALMWSMGWPDLSI